MKWQTSCPEWLMAYGTAEKSAAMNHVPVSADELLVDVVNCAANGVASNLSAAIEVLPHEEKMRVLKVVAALIGR